MGRTRLYEFLVYDVDLAPAVRHNITGARNEIHAADIWGREAWMRRSGSNAAGSRAAGAPVQRPAIFGAAPLHPVSTATSVRVREGKRLVTDGPFAETREQLGGYFLVDAKDLDEAIDIAGRIPGARWGPSRCGR